MSDVDKWYRNYWARHQGARCHVQDAESAMLFLRKSRRAERNGASHLRSHPSCRPAAGFGAGDKRSRASFWPLVSQGRYETLDISAEDQHEYSSSRQITGHFDAILCLEVIEHMSLNDYVDLMDEFGRLLNPGGTLVIWYAESPLCRSHVGRRPRTCAAISIGGSGGGFCGARLRGRSFSRALWRLAQRHSEAAIPRHARSLLSAEC